MSSESTFRLAAQHHAATDERRLGVAAFGGWLPRRSRLIVEPLGGHQSSDEAMPRMKIIVSREAPSPGERLVISELVVETDSTKRPTAKRVARLLAQSCPGFARAKGRYAIRAGVEVLPVLEVTQTGWCAWRLETGDDSPSGWQPPIPGSVGKLNSVNNPFADRSKGVWLRADISER